MVVIKIILWIYAFSFLLGSIFAVLPWGAITSWFVVADIQPPGAEAITMFVFRLFCVLCWMIGVLFAILAQNPLKYGAMLLLASYGMVIFGIFSLAASIRYGLPGWIYIKVVIWGVGAGLLLLFLRKKAIESSTA